MEVRKGAGGYSALLCLRADLFLSNHIICAYYLWCQHRGTRYPWGLTFYLEKLLPIHYYIISYYIISMEYRQEPIRNIFTRIHVFSYPLYSSLKAPWSKQVHEDADTAGPYTCQPIPSSDEIRAGMGWDSAEVASVSISLINQTRPPLLIFFLALRLGFHLSMTWNPPGLWLHVGVQGERTMHPSQYFYAHAN